MKRGGLIFIGVLVVLIIGVIVSYNSMVGKRNIVEAQWHQVENQYQRRLDLIPNLVATVQNVSAFEKSTLEAVMNARASATQVKIDPSNMDAASLQKFDQAQTAVSSSLGRLLAVAEAYPDIKSVQNFSDLQTQLEGTENRISTERGRFNDAVLDYNNSIQTFPRNLYAGMFGFKEKPYFEAKAGAENPPSVDSLFKKK